jgi:hypothetical protein
VKSVKFDKKKDLQGNIQSLLVPNKDEILHIFEVVPIDHRVRDFSSPKLVLTPSKLFLTFDEVIEIYNLPELEIDVIGSPPRFTIWELILEGSYTYSMENEDQLRNLRTDEILTRVSIAEPNSVSKDFVMRTKSQVDKSYKTWAMGRTIMNTKHGSAPNKILTEMLSGYFSVLNQRTVIAFIASFVAYFVLKPIAYNFLPGFVNSILDIALGGILIFMVWWLYSTGTNNLNRYKSVYLSYKA